MVKSDAFTIVESDFIAVGDYSSTFESYIDDEIYQNRLMQYMKSYYYDVYEIKTVDIFKTIRI